MKRVLALIITLPLVVIGVEWQSLNGPPAGRADDMSMGWDPHIPAWVIYAADQTHKLYKSVNEGELWQVPTQEEQVDNPTCVITDVNNAQVVYIGKNSDVPVWKSTNGGETWEPKSYGITNTHPLCFAMDPSNPNVVYLGCEGAGNQPSLFKTTNGGVNWSGCGNFPTNIPVFDICIKSDEPNILYVATNIGTYKSTNYGSNWIQLNSPPNSSFIQAITLNVDLQPPTLFVANTNLQSGAWIYYTKDDGAHWYLALTLYGEDIEPSGIAVEENSSGQIMYATFSPIGFYKSTNGGVDWFPAENGLVDKTLKCLMCHPSGNGIIYTGGEFAVYRSNNYGEAWTEKTKGMALADMRKISVKENNFYGIIFHRSGDDGVVSYNCGIDIWKFIYHNPGWYGTDIEIATTNNNIIYEAIFSDFGDYGYVVKSTNGGMSWDLVLAAGNYGISDLDASETNADIVYASSYVWGGLSPLRVYRTTNGGNSWDYYQFSYEKGDLNAVAAQADNDAVVYTGGWWRSLDESNQGPVLEKSTDGGVNWFAQDGGLKGRIRVLSVDPINLLILK
jgi:photosystem II stability/assembly factor-like uncharacterized protein